MHLADAFIQSDLHLFRLYIILSVMTKVPWELNPQPFCAANTMLYHWAKGTLSEHRYKQQQPVPLSVFDPQLYDLFHGAQNGVLKSLHQPDSPYLM